MGGSPTYIKDAGVWSPWDGSTKNKVWNPSTLSWVSMTQPTGGGGLVDSVNGQTGAVVLDADDISDDATAHKFVTSDQQAALDSANTPSAGNPVATIADITGGTPGDTVVSETSYGQSATAGAAAAYSREDHTHGTPASESGRLPILTANPAADPTAAQVYEFQDGSFRAMRIMSSEGHITTIEEWSV